MPIPKREVIKDLIEKGGATKESLMRDAECSISSLNTNFLYLRLMGFYPVADTETGVYSFIGEAEWNELQRQKEEAAKAKKAKPAALQELLLVASRRLERAEKTAAMAIEKQQSGDDTRLTELRVIKSKAELEIAQILFEEMKARCQNAGIDVDTVLTEASTATEGHVDETLVIEDTDDNTSDDSDELV